MRAARNTLLRRGRGRDVDGLVELLAADVVVCGDSGGTSPSWRRPIYGRDKVARLMLGLRRPLRELGGSIRRIDINASQACDSSTARTTWYVMTVDIADGVV